MNRINNNCGFTMLELLVAVVLLAIGMLGLAASQVFAMKNNNNSTTRNSAINLASKVADSLRANRTVVDLYATNGVPISANGQLTKPACTKSESVGCRFYSPEDFVNLDKYLWQEEIKRVLPEGGLEIVVSNPGAEALGVTEVTLELRWVELTSVPSSSKSVAVEDNGSRKSMTFRVRP